MPEHAVDDGPPDPAFAVVAAQPVDERHTNAVDVVPQLGEKRGQHRQRPEHRNRDHRHRGDRERGEVGVSGEEHACHGHEDGEPRDENRSTGGRCRRLECGLLAPAGRTLLAFALQVEHRVVDADREPDQEDDRADAVTHRQRLAEYRHETHRREDGREPQQERDARCDERAEGDQEDAQRQGDGVEPRLLEVVEERSLDLLPGALAERSDVEARVRLLNLVDGGDDRIDVVDGLVGGTGDVDGDQHRVLVTGDQAGVLLGVEGRFDLRDLRKGRDFVDHRLDDRLELRRGRRQLRVLDDDGLTGRLLEVLVENRVRPSGLPGPGGLPDDLLLREERVPDRKRHEREREPAEDRLLSMVGAPPGHPRSKIRGSVRVLLDRGAGHRGLLPKRSLRPT